MTNYENLRNKKQKKYIKKLKAENALLQFKLNGANGVVARQMDHIAMLNLQLEQQDHAIERKDAQWLGLRMAFQDALINNQV